MDARHIEFCHRAKEVGFRQAFMETYGSDEESPKEWAIRLREVGLTHDQIAACVKLRFGMGCRLTIQRWTTPGAAEKHNAYRRKRTRNARKYARNLATRGFPLGEIQKRIRDKYSEYVEYVEGWTKLG